MWSSCFNPGSSSGGGVDGVGGSSSITAHSLGSTGSLPGPGTPLLSAHPSLLLSAQSSKSLNLCQQQQQQDQEEDTDLAPAGSDDSGCGGEDTHSQGSGSGLDAVMSESPRAADQGGSDSSSHKVLFGAEYGEPDCQLIGHGWELWAHKHVLKSKSVGRGTLVGVQRVEWWVVMQPHQLWRLEVETGKHAVLLPVLTSILPLLSALLLLQQQLLSPPQAVLHTSGRAPALA